MCSPINLIKLEFCIHFGCKRHFVNKSKFTLKVLSLGPPFPQRTVTGMVGRGPLYVCSAAVAISWYGETGSVSASMWFVGWRLESLPAGAVYRLLYRMALLKEWAVDMQAGSDLEAA